MDKMKSMVDAEMKAAGLLIAAVLRSTQFSSEVAISGKLKGILCKSRQESR